MTPRSFLELLWQYKPEEQYILIWTLQDKRSHWFTDVTKAAEFVAATAKDLDVYVGVGLSKEDHGPARRCKSEEVSGICGIGTDLDLKSEAHGNKPLPTTLADALSVLPKDMPPTIIVATGNGAHAWWLLKEPHPIETEQERADVARLVARWHTMLRLKSAAKGWVYDRLSDLARVLRIAGTQNHKDPANPKDVTVFSQTDRFYNLSDFEEYPGRRADPRPGGGGARGARVEGAVRGQASYDRPERHHPQGDARRVDARGHEVPEHLEPPASRPQGPERVRVRSGSGVLRHRRRSVGAADRGPDLPPPRRPTASRRATGWITTRGPSPRLNNARAGARRRRPSVRARLRRRPRPAWLRHRAPRLRPRARRRPTLPPSLRTRPPRPRTRRCRRRSCASGSRRP